MSELLTILSSVGFNWHVALANLFNFLIILVLLHSFFFKKIAKTIRNRTEMIERGLERAVEGEKMLAEAEEKKGEILSEAKKESHLLVEGAKKKAEELAQTLRLQAEQEIALKKEAIAVEEKALSQKVEKEFLSKAGHLVASLYASTLQKEMTEEENNRLVSSLSR